MTDLYSVERLEEFILSVAENEKIPATERLDFISHLQETGRIDEKAAQFVNHYLHVFEADALREAQEAKQNAASLRSALRTNQNPQFSLQKNIITRAQEDITSLVNQYKNQWKNFVSRKRSAHELEEQIGEARAIKHLKESLS